MNPIITALLIFGGTVQVIADLIVIDKRLHIVAAVRAIVQKAKLRRQDAANLKRAKANFEIWRLNRPCSSFERLPFAVQRMLGDLPTNELSRIEVNLEGNDLDWAIYQGRK